MTKNVTQNESAMLWDKKKLGRILIKGLLDEFA